VENYLGDNVSEKLDSVLNQGQMYYPTDEFKKQALISTKEEYEALHKRSIKDPEGFWGEIAEELHWFKKWEKVLNEEKAPFYKWFEGGKTNMSYNCLDRQIANGLGDKVAVYWEGEPVDDKKTYTYTQLLAEVSQFANALKSKGVEKGDVVAIYLPMIPELMISQLACARIGAIHSIVFGGFSAQAIADRVNDAQAKLVITADTSYRRGKPLELKKVVDEAVETCNTVENVVVVKRSGADVEWNSDLNSWYDDMTAAESTECACEEMDSQDPLFILYTSGSTGKPKGIQHTTGGYMVGTYLSTKYIFDVKDNDVYWCTADIGWITGHSYVTYGPLNNGMSQVMYEGAPNFPQENRFWDIIERYKVTTFYTAPTAIRAFMKWGEEHVNKHDLSSLRLLGSVGEPINPEAWNWYHKVIGAEKCPIVDTWWQTETGSIMMTPLPGFQGLKPGSCTVPFFGVDVACVDEAGNRVPDNESGILVIRRPWPAMLSTIYKDDDRFVDTYWGRFSEQGFYLAGDSAMRDSDGCHWILGRIDDVINVSGHRLSTAEVEAALVAHPSVVEAAAVGFKHDLKGEGISIFVTVANDVEKDDATKKALVMHIRKEIGALASPDKIYFGDNLPKTRSGKIMRRLLRQISNGEEITGDTSTLEDVSVLGALQSQN
jgi:acetyl-CoA synthetase